MYRAEQHGDRRPTAILIAGPTASGKSALALELARRFHGTVINTDSMQVYRDLRILSARPTVAEEAAVPHRLYGHRDAAENCSVGHWLRDAEIALAAVREEGRLPIFVGGTGLYFKALTQGLADVPPTPPAVRATLRARLARDGIAALHAELARHDPVAAARLPLGDTTRITRALEVWETTGRSLQAFQAEAAAAPLIPSDQALAVFLAPDRTALYARIDARFAVMLREGALDEVARLAARRLDPLLPAMKAHGVPWLIRHLAGEITLEQAAMQACLDTRHYAKRQFTWFRNQLTGFRSIDPTEAISFIETILAPPKYRETAP